MDILLENGPTCTCSEGKVGGMPTELRRHDCEYVAYRNSLIPAAAAFADRAVPDDRGGRDWWLRFARRMNELMDKQNGTAA